MYKVIIKWPLLIIKWVAIDLFFVAALGIAIVLVLIPFMEPDDIANCMPPTGTCEYWGH
jgi:hypothetical protein